METRLIASMISNGNEIVEATSREMTKTMTPLNCEDTAIKEHFIYAEIVMALILKVRLSNRNFWNTAKVGNLHYSDFILNIGNADNLRRLNANPPQSLIFDIFH